jgi:hypothetical protein
MKEEDALKQEIEALDSAPRRTRSRSRAQSSSRSGAYMFRGLKLAIQVLFPFLPAPAYILFVEELTDPKLLSSKKSRSLSAGGNVKISVENEVEHDFASHTFLMPTSCDQCGKLIVFGCKCTCMRDACFG